MRALYLIYKESQLFLYVDNLSITFVTLWLSDKCIIG